MSHTCPKAPTFLLHLFNENDHRGVSKGSNELSHCVHILCFKGIWKTILLISDEVLFNLSFQVLQSRYTALSCLHIFVCWFPLEGSAWIEVLTLSHNSVGWVPSCFSSEAKSTQWGFSDSKFKLCQRRDFFFK